MTLAVGCSAPPPPRTNDPQPVVTGSPNAGASYDVSPVPAPAGVVAKLRARDLGTTLRVGGTLIGAPAGGSDDLAVLLLGELFAGRRGLRLDVSGADLAKQVALDAPVDVVVALESGRTGVHVAFSMGLKSLDDARAAAGSSVVETGAGVWQIGGEKAKGACAIMASAGPTKGRIVCGARDADLVALGPYMARTLSVEPATGKDINADIDVAAMNARFGDDLKKLLPGAPNLAKRRYGIGNATYDSALENGARFVVDDLALLLGEVKNVHFEAAVNETTGIDLSGRVDFAGSPKSWLGRAALATPAAAVPSIFWQGPGDADGAWLGVFGDPSNYGDLTKALKGMLIGALEKDKVGSDAERKKVAALLDLPIVKNTAIVAFGGTGRVTKLGTAKSAKEKWQQGFDLLMGWYVVGLEQKGDGWIKWMKDAAAAFNQPGMQKGIKGAIGKNDTLTLKSVAAPKQLGKNATALELGFSSKIDQTEGVLTFMAMSDGERTWLGAGFDKNEVAERLVRAKEGKDSLKDRAELASLKKESVASAAFATLRSFRSTAFSMILMRSPETQGDPADIMISGVKEADKLFDGLPGRGRAPIYIKTGGSGLAMTFSLSMGKGVLDDIKSLTSSLRQQAAQGGAAPLPPPPKPRSK
ncbi:MAG: hypothetical protein JNK04_16895 [Myxococcales bacterium]|nr:hypothetical protein [Myxococcales bacterium]